MVTTVENGVVDLERELAVIAEADQRRGWLTEPEPEVAASIFAARTGSFTLYRVSLQFRDKIMGGTPKAGDVIEGWLRAKAGATTEDEVTAMTVATLAQTLGVDPASAQFSDLVKASEEVADVKSLNGFKRDDLGLYIEGRAVKAMLKECTNIVYAGEKWGPTRKGARNFLAERVFVAEDRIHLGVDQPSGQETVIGHVTGPQGPRATLGRHEFVTRAKIEFCVMSHRDCIKPDQWEELLILGQEIGLGALRSQGYGRFNVTGFNRV